MGMLGIYKIVHRTVGSIIQTVWLLVQPPTCSMPEFCYWATNLKWSVLDQTLSTSTAPFVPSLGWNAVPQLTREVQLNELQAIQYGFCCAHEEQEAAAG